MHSFANNANAITTTTQNSASSITVGHYSLTVLQIPGTGAAVVTVPAPPGSPTVSNLSSSTSSLTSGKATLGWAAGTAGTYPVAGYKVYQTTSTGKTLIASPTGTTLNLTGLTIGESYRHQVAGAPRGPRPATTSQ